ncbi:DUF87 domain-containing protein [Candidatus Babeliales bacterium]|nr:DUF87 domain-containing protein [Candidatus Babeliales bacterium]
MKQHITNEVSNMSESERTYYGTDDPQERKIQMYGERRPRKGVAEKYLETTTITAEEAMVALDSVKHNLIIGTTGSGKTYFVAKLTQKFNTFIFVNTQEEEDVEAICQAVTSTPADILDLFGRGYTKIEFVPSENAEEAVEQLEEIRQILFNLGASLYPKRRPDDPSMNYIIDEGQLYAPKMARTDLDNIGTRGRRWGVRGIFLTQRPQLFSSTLINMCELQLIFRTGQYEAKYFNGYKIPVEAHKEWLDKEFHSILWDGRVMKRVLPAP